MATSEQNALAAEPQKPQRPSSWETNSHDSLLDPKESPTRSLAKKSAFQPRDAKVSRESGLLDLAMFLRENPTPINYGPVASTTESKPSEIEASPSSRLVKRVLKAGSRRSNRKALLERPKSRSGLRPKPVPPHSTTGHKGNQQTSILTTRIAQASGANPEESDRSAPLPPSVKRQPKENMLALPFDEEKSGPNLFPSLANLLNGDVHGMYVTWLENEVKKNRRASGHSALPDAASPAIDQYLAQNLTAGEPGKRTSLTNHPTSPPPQKPLPPTPNPKGSLVAQPSSKNDRHTAGQPSTIRHSESEQPLRKNTPPETIRKTLSSDAINQGGRSEGLASPSGVAKDNVEAAGPPLAANERQSFSRGSSDTVPSSYTMARETELDGKTTSPGTSIRTSTSQNTSRELARKIREDRTRARKLKHLKSDSHSTGGKESLSSNVLTPSPIEKILESDPLEHPNIVKDIGNGKPETPAQEISNEEELTPKADSDSLLLREIDEPLRPTSPTQDTGHETKSSPTNTSHETKTPQSQPDSSAPGSQRASPIPNDDPEMATPEVTDSTPKSSNEGEAASTDLPNSATAAEVASHSSNSRPSTKDSYTTTSPNASPSPTATMRDFRSSPRSQRAQYRQFQSHHRYGPPSPGPTSPLPPTPLTPKTPTTTKTVPHSPNTNNSGGVARSASRSSGGSSHRQNLTTRVANLERENKLLEAALMAVLKTGGALNRCPCPCFCDILEEWEGQEHSHDNGGSVGYQQHQHQQQQQPPQSPGPRWSYVNAGNAPANRNSQVSSSGSGAGSGSNALALYMQTRRASGFGYNMDAAKRTAQ